MGSVWRGKCVLCHPSPPLPSPPCQDADDTLRVEELGLEDELVDMELLSSQGVESWKGTIDGGEDGLVVDTLTTGHSLAISSLLPVRITLFPSLPFLLPHSFFAFPSSAPPLPLPSCPVPLPLPLCPSPGSLPTAVFPQTPCSASRLSANCPDNSRDLQ